MARGLAVGLLKEKDDDTRMKRMFTLLACRPPKAVETKACFHLLDSMRKRFREDSLAARDLLATGETPVPGNLDPIEVAAWSQVASAVLASDVAILAY